MFGPARAPYKGPTALAEAEMPMTKNPTSRGGFATLGGASARREAYDDPVIASAPKGTVGFVLKLLFYNFILNVVCRCLCRPCQIADAILLYQNKNNQKIYISSSAPFILGDFCNLFIKLPFFSQISVKENFYIFLAHTYCIYVALAVGVVITVTL